MKSRVACVLVAGVVCGTGICRAESSEPVQWPLDQGGNGNFYEVVPVAGISWSDARDAALDRRWDGRNGHLVSVTSQAEADFLRAALGSSLAGCWVGAEQADATVGVLRGWSWTTGESWGFEDWDVGEPNDVRGNEDAVAFSASTDASKLGRWHDQLKSFGHLRGFVVEYPANDQGQPIAWSGDSGGNGHAYEVVEVPAEVTWYEALPIAESRSYRGSRGYLATITEAAETDFLTDAFGDRFHACWLGGVQLNPASAPADGWVWVTGEPWDYTNWSANEPGDQDPFGGTEDALVVKGVPGGGFPPGEWNDRSSDRPRPRFLVEYPSRCHNDRDTITYEVMAFIDGRDHLVIRGGEVRWHHFEAAAVGRWEGANEPTRLTTWSDCEPVISDDRWIPVWPEEPPAEIRYEAQSEWYPIAPSLWQSMAQVEIDLVVARDLVTLVESPSPANNYTLRVEFSDPSFEPAWYLVRVTVTRCSAADLSSPGGALTFADIGAFLDAFVSMQNPADFALPVGEYTFADISAFLTMFVAGCP